MHIDIQYLPKMPDERARRYLFVAIDRATRWVFLRTYRDQTERSRVDFLRRVHKATPFRIPRLLTDNGTPGTDRFTRKNKQPTGKHVFDKPCQHLHIEHRLAFTYNHHIPQRSLGHLSPVDALKSWREKKPEIVIKRVYKQAELDN